MTMYVNGLAEIVLWVQDKPAAVRFYSELLGLPVISPPALPNVFLKVGDGHTGVPQMIVLVPLPADRADQPRQGQLHHLAFELPARDFDALADRLRDAGYQPRGGKHPVLAARTIYVDDPDGNEVEFICMHKDE